MWIVDRINVPWTTRRRSSARVSSWRSKLASLDQRPMYADGAYCVCTPPIRSMARVSGRSARSSNICRASNARFNSRSVSVRAATAGVYGAHSRRSAARPSERRPAERSAELAPERGSSARRRGLARELDREQRGAYDRRLLEMLDAHVGSDLLHACHQLVHEA